MNTSHLIKITWQRSKAIVLILGFLLVFFSVVYSTQQTNAWIRNQNYAKSKVAKQSYQNYLQAQKSTEKKINQKYKESQNQADIWKYISSISDSSQVTFDQKTNHFNVKADSYKSFTGDGSQYLFTQYSVDGNHTVRNPQKITVTTVEHSGFIFALKASLGQAFTFNLFTIFFIIAGFALCFWDYKSNFTLLLFSSGYRRKDLLKSKIKTSLFPLLAFSVVAMGVNLAILYARIPHQYINYPFEKLFALHLCVLVIATVNYFIGLFVGLIVGQVLTGLLSLCGFYFGLTLILENILNLAGYLSGQKQGTADNLYGIFDSYAGWLVISIILIIIGIILYFAAQKAYQHLSLEERNNYLLFPKLRIPLIVFATLFVPLAIFGNLSYLYYPEFYPIDPPFIGHRIIKILITMGITAFAMILLNNQQKVYQWISKMSK